MKRIVIAAGGTGGHLFPAQALASELVSMGTGLDVLFMGKGLSSSRYFQQALFPCIDVNARTCSFRPCSFFAACRSNIQGIRSSIAALKKYACDLVVGFGSYHTFPVLAAAAMLRIPMILHAADSVPGRVNRLFSPVAKWTGIFFPDAGRKLWGIYREVDIPLRVHFQSTVRPTKREALRYYGLSEEKTTVLIFGGSQGARRVNQLLCETIRKLPATEVQVIHLTGDAMYEEVLRAYTRHAISASVKSFEEKMHYAWAASDCVVSRAGAGSIAEAMAFGVPSILIPFPSATDDHQEKNGRYVEEVMGGGICLQEACMSPEVLQNALGGFLDPVRRREMRVRLETAYAAKQKCRFSHQVLQELHGG